jgi:predicted PurR-regulated permease PerM
MLRTELPRALQQLEDLLKQRVWGRVILESLPSLETTFSAGEAAISNAMTAFSKVSRAVGYLLFVLFTFLFVAYQPQLYRRGIEALIPPEHRPRARRVLDHIWVTLWWWLAARVLAMSLVGVLITLGLWTLGIPFALSLGLLAAVLDFVPNFGPLIAAIPAVILAAVNSPEYALYVVLLYWAVQIIEGYVITPVAQKKAINMPPALLIISQFVLGAAVGPLGFILATPITAMALVIIKDLYLEPGGQPSRLE